MRIEVHLTWRNTLAAALSGVVCGVAAYVLGFRLGDWQTWLVVAVSWVSFELGRSS